MATEQIMKRRESNLFLDILRYLKWDSDSENLHLLKQAVVLFLLLSSNEGGCVTSLLFSPTENGATHTLFFLTFFSKFFLHLISSKKSR